MSTSGNLNDLVERVLERAQQEAAEVVGRAHKAAEREILHAQEQCRERKAAAEVAMREGAERRKHVVRAEARQDERRAVMNAREMAVEDVFSGALKALATIDDPAARGDLLAALVREGIQALNVPAVRVHLNAAERDLAQTAFSAELDGVAVVIAEQTLEASGGPVVTDESGRVIFENTFEARLDRKRESLRRQVAEVLRLHDEEGAQ